MLREREGNGEFDSSSFARTGVVGPLRVLPAEETPQLLAALRDAEAPLDWMKGWAASSEAYYRIGTNPTLLDVIGELLGSDVMLCGANLIERDPGQDHEWHIDVHLAQAGGSAVTVWIGLENTTPETSLDVVPGSHRIGTSPQEIAVSRGTTIGKGNDRVLGWAQEHDPEASVVRVGATDGEAVIIDASVWHGSLHAGDTTRVALLLHYATPDKPVRLHGAGHDWPYEFVEDPLPPCVMVSGEDRFRRNRIVPPPAGVGEATSRLIPLDRAAVIGPPGWKPMAGFKGPTNTLPELTVKHHRIGAGPPDTDREFHSYEQIVVALNDGGDYELGPAPHPFTFPVNAGTVVYVPPGTEHRLSAPEEAEHIHLDIAWEGVRRDHAVPWGAARFELSDIAPDPEQLAERKRSAFELGSGPTATIDGMRLLLVDMEPGFVGEPDVDDYDAVVVVLAGAINTLDGRANAGDVVLYGAGETHQISVSGDEPVRLFIAELRGGGGSPARTGGRAAKKRAVGGSLASPLRRKAVDALPRSVRIELRRRRRALRMLRSRLR